MKFGVTLSNRGVLVGLITTRDLLELADAVEASPLMDSVWCGDALFVNRRLDALTLFAAVAGRTERVLLGPGLHGLVCAPRPDGVCLRMGLPRRDLQRPHAACGLRGRRRGPAVGGGNRGDGDQSRRPAQAHGREHARAPPSLDPGQRAVRRQFRQILQHHAGAQAGPESLSDLACDQRRAAVDRAGGFRRLGIRADPRRQDRRWLDDAFGQPGGLSQILGFHLEGGRRAGPRHVALRPRAVPPHQRERRQGREPRGLQEVPRPVLHRQLFQGAPGGLADLRLAARLHRASQAVQGRPAATASRSGFRPWAIRWRS